MYNTKKSVHQVSTEQCLNTVVLQRFQSQMQIFKIVVSEATITLTRSCSHSMSLERQIRYGQIFLKP